MLGLGWSVSFDTRAGVRYEGRVSGAEIATERSSSDGLLTGKVALITGAGSGIGEATAARFGAEGARLVLNDAGLARDGTPGDNRIDQVAEGLRRQGLEVVTSSDDVSTVEGSERAVRQALEHFGQLDVLVNSTGILRDKAFLRMSLEDFEAAMRHHLLATFLVSQRAARCMLDAGRGGRLITTVGSAGLHGNLGQANYAAAAAAVYGLTRTMSIELQRFDITVNAVAPLAKTRLTQDLPMFEHVDSMGPEHVAPVHLFLASELSRDLSGYVVGIAGGRLSLHKVVESVGQFKDADAGVWTPQEIAEVWRNLSKQ